LRGQRQVTAASAGAQRRREQYGVSAAVQVRLQQLFEQDRHVGIGSVHFIDYQQAASQGGMAQVGMGNLQGAEQAWSMVPTATGAARKRLAFSPAQRRVPPDRPGCRTTEP
jgi:hypothetical protein